MNSSNKLAGKGRHILYLILASGMLFFALTQLEQGGAGSAAKVFWYTWLAFAAVIIAANVNMLLFVSEEKRKHLARIKREKALQLERVLEKGLARRAGSERGVRKRS